MLKRLVICMIIVMFGLPLLAGCSGGNGKKEKSAVTKQTDKVAKEAVKTIKTPINRAKNAAKTQDQYGKKLKEQVAN